MNLLNKLLFFQHQIQEFISLFKYLSSLEMCGCLEECVEEEKPRKKGCSRKGGRRLVSGWDCSSSSSVFAVCHTVVGDDGCLLLCTMSTYQQTKVQDESHSLTYVEKASRNLLLSD